MSDLAKYALQVAKGDTGISSECIAAYMSGVDMNNISKKCAPSDPSDLGRCLRLLEIFPEWKGRMSEMASVSKDWATIVPHWNKLAELMEQEVGIDWSKGKKAPITYDVMSKIRRDAGEKW